VTVNVRIGKPKADRPKLEVGVLCQAAYDVETKVTRSDDTDYRRETHYRDLFEEWPPFDPSLPEQSITVRVPEDAPFTYRGTAFGFSWSALAREKRRWFQSDAGRVAVLEVLPRLAAGGEPRGAADLHGRPRLTARFVVESGGVNRRPAYRVCRQAGVLNPPSPGCSGDLPTVLGISPAIGPPFSAPAGVWSVRLAPSSSTPTQLSGVRPWTCAPAGAAGSSAIAATAATAAISALQRRRADLLSVI
jgi:hypothetical protein